MKEVKEFEKCDEKEECLCNKEIKKKSIFGLIIVAFSLFVAIFAISETVNSGQLRVAALQLIMILFILAPVYGVYISLKYLEKAKVINWILLVASVITLFAHIIWIGNILVYS